MKLNPDLQKTQPIPAETIAEVVDRGYANAPHVRFDVTDVDADLDQDLTDLDLERQLRASRPTTNMRGARLRVA